MGERKDTDNTLRSQVDGYGFDRSHDPNPEVYDEFMAEYLSVLARRASRWKELLSSGTGIVKNSKVKRFCRKGIPNEHRKSVWMLLSGAEEKMKMNPKAYKLLLINQKDKSIVETIELDLHRTFPENIYFSTKDGLRNSLSNVLVALSHYNPDKGYSQGLNFIAGLLLLVVKDEESVFWLMDCMIKDLIPDFYSPGMEAVKAEQELLGEVIKWKDPSLYEHIESVGVQWCLVGTKWFMCLFADVLPTETVLRVWDCLFNEGSKVLLRVAAMLILQNKERLMACNSFTSMVNEIQTIIKNPWSLNCHLLMKNCFKKLGSFPSARIERMRQACLVRVGE
ncbi:growth hormone-regulated TBC protein 1-A-like [Ostrea edulis]|uniref:growth hormone-regulated TBC protein 1-A-like n=1 Tax=Ostrea edulis TaxID=37623 RepID=UPI0024AED0C3|nr:growth hormone-regulated TBC protein 1-A-like [Ostrea edulis]